MSYLVIDVDGTLHVRDAEPTAEAITREVGWWDTVRLPATGNLACGFVSDTGLIDGQTPRNVVGSVLLMCGCASQQPYAGPIVITGWDPSPSDESEIRPLTSWQLATFTAMHGCITKALAGDDSCPRCTQQWRAQVRAAAELVRSAPTSTIQILYPDDLGRS